MPTNTWRGTCRFCGKKVGVRKGFVGKGDRGQWLVWHGKCDPDPPKPQPPQPPRVVRFPYAND